MRVWNVVQGLEYQGKIRFQPRRQEKQPRVKKTLKSNGSLSLS